MSVFKHKNGYYGYNFMYKGHRYCKSFKGLSHDDVKELELVHRAELAKGNYDITKKKTYFLDEIISDYKEYRKAHYTRPDEFNYVIDKFYELTGNKDVEQITSVDFEKYINFRLNKVKNSTINREFDNIRRVFSFALENGKLKFNPCKAIKKLRIENPPVRFLSKDEENKLLPCCNPMMRAIVITALYTGMRQNELLSLKWQDVFFDENYLFALNTKNNKIREIPIVPRLKQELLKLKHVSEYVFSSPVSFSKYIDIKKTFGEAVKRAKIPHITFHKLRHTTASRLNELGVDIITIQKILDHASIKTTLKYVHNNNFSVVNAFERLNNY